ncbi:hypothetical protein [Neisseria perflava]|uniref:hypothetical protein n=1 Tax=Neisseria perflava TaxID=33053 RepID=UPI0020A1BA25|nr:hypothetical protein [Neisseria perflava]MCP1660676.1 hypothetical protein [Neisseria perflava]MCP1771876.1 hypothetical protein [Neisseria perflava]
MKPIRYLPLALVLAAAVCADVAHAMSPPPPEVFMVLNRCQHEVSLKVKQSRKMRWSMIRPRENGKGWETVGRERVMTAELASGQAFYLLAHKWGLFKFHPNRRPHVAVSYQGKKVPFAKNWRVADDQQLRQRYSFFEGLLFPRATVIACPDNMTNNDKAIWQRK